MLAKRDLAVMLLSAFAVYYSLQHDGVITFNRAWHLPNDDGRALMPLFTNVILHSTPPLMAVSVIHPRNQPNPPGVSAALRVGLGSRGDPVTHRGVDDHPPVPVFFDLNGDGEKEVIVAGRGPEIRIVAPPSGGGSGASGGAKGGSSNPGNGAPSSDGDVFAAVKTMAKASLMPGKVRVAVGRHAIALAAGHLTPPSPEHGAGSRKGIVVVVTASWHVLCFDHNLKLLWENSLQEEFPRWGSARWNQVDP
jgi:hypothetical protein